MYNLDNIIATRRPTEIKRDRDKSLRAFTAFTLESISKDPMEYRELSFTTYKVDGKLVTRARVDVVKDSGRGYMTSTHEVFGDFNKTVASVPTKRVTEKSLQEAHGAVVHDKDLLDTVLYNVQLHYTAKASKEV